MLSTHARALLEDSGNMLLLSAASVWEIGVKHALGRLRLPNGLPPAALIPDALALALLPRCSREARYSLTAPQWLSCARRSVDDAADHKGQRVAAGEEEAPLIHQSLAGFTWTVADLQNPSGVTSACRGVPDNAEKPWLP